MSKAEQQFQQPETGESTSNQSMFDKLPISKRMLALIVVVIVVGVIIYGVRKHSQNKTKTTNNSNDESQSENDSEQAEDEDEVEEIHIDKTTSDPLENDERIYEAIHGKSAS